MNRFLALIAALLAALVSVSSACTAAAPQLLRFTLDQERGAGDRIHADFRDTNSRDRSNWSSDFRASELVGLDLGAFRANSAAPLRFAMIREAGRLDCSGHGGHGAAVGNCTFTPDAQFVRLLQSRGIGTPTGDRGFALMAVNARRELIDAVATARYPTPSMDDLIALSALGVNGGYIAELARAGYRPSSIDTLVQFKALGISPQWISGFARIGYASLPADELVQLKALNITPEFVLGFDRLGYGRLPADDLVQLKALGITPEFAQRMAVGGATLPRVEKLVHLKLFSAR